MASNARVLNLTNRCTIKKSQALRRIEQCISTWVVEGYEIRDLSLSERVQARAVQSRAEEEAFPLAEVPGVRVRDIADLPKQKRTAVATTFLFGAKSHMLNNPKALEILDNAATQFCLAHA
jgi:hypothetical protein